jgi:ankyrin repeat protein
MMAIGDLARVQWLVVEGGAKINDADDQGNSPLLLAAMNGQLPTLQFLLEHKGAHVANSIWVMVNIHLLRLGPEAPNADEVTSLLRVMVYTLTHTHQR